MAVSSQSYFNALKSYLFRDYIKVPTASDQIVLTEDVYFPGEKTPVKFSVKMGVAGEALVIKLDRFSNKRLFHFLEEESRPWSKKCDYVVFQSHRNQLKAYCIEFKSASLPDSLVAQLAASMSWCQSLHSTIKHYTGMSKKINLTKYVFSCHPNPAIYLDGEGKYLLRDHTIRHYQYAEVDGMPLKDLENTNIEEIR